MNTCSRFLGKVVLVTGGTSGIGKAAVFRLLDEGAHVVFCGRDASKGQTILANLGSEKAKQAHFIQADIGRIADILVLFTFIKNHFGKLDAAFNVAGIIGKDTPSNGIKFHQSPEIYFDEVFDINVKGLWNCMKQELAFMFEQKGGAIVNCASVAGLRTANSRSVIYTASKHAVLGITKATAVEYAPEGVRINAICPGIIKTPLIDQFQESLSKKLQQKNPGARLGEPEEVVASALFLLSDEASYINGSILTIDAGGLFDAL